MSVVSGTRCQCDAHRRIPGESPPATPGTLVSQRENLGRELFTVDSTAGQKVILFAHEIEVVRDDLRVAAEMGDVVMERPSRPPRAIPQRPAIAGTMIACVFADSPASGATRQRSPRRRHIAGW